MPQGTSRLRFSLTAAHDEEDVDQLIEAVIRFLVRYRNGAFDPLDMNLNGWKRAPLLEAVGLDYVARPVVELHEETR